VYNFTNMWGRLNGHILHSSFQSLNRLYQKNKIYHKMQREKFYNLRKTAYFIVALFVLIRSKILSDQFSTLQKRYFFGTRWIHFFPFHLLVTWYFLFKKNKMHQKMQRKKPYNLYKMLVLSAYFLFPKKVKFYPTALKKKSFFSIRREIFFFSEI
jgi:hypothetical protein